MIFGNGSRTCSLRWTERVTGEYIWEMIFERVSLVGDNAVERIRRRAQEREWRCGLSLVQLKDMFIPIN